VIDRPRRRTQLERSTASREHIVDAAVAVFALKGYAAASMDDVRLAAGCSKGGLYHHFPGKSTLMAAVVARLALVGGLAPPLDAAASRLSATPVALGRLLVELWAATQREPALRDQLRDQQVRAPGAHAALVEALLAGALVADLTRGEWLDPAAAERLGIPRAA
jgi:AcrR family transcriptional regulator